MRGITLVGVLAAALLAAPAVPAQAATTACNFQRVTIPGTDGDDRLQGTDGNDVFAGEGGNDTIIGMGGNDIACPGPGDDTFIGGPGNDVMLADPTVDGADTFTEEPGTGQGIDAVFYRERTVDVNVSLNDLPNDGQAGEGDNIDSDVEQILGGSGNDTLRGSNGNNTLRANAGNDTLIGVLGDDLMTGGSGDDRFIASITVDGADRMLGEGGTDTADYGARNNLAPGTLLTLTLNETLGDDGEPDEGDSLIRGIENVRGGTGRNLIIGNASPNVIYGGQSNDTISTQDGRDNDVIHAGFGFDVCTVDPADIEDCELP